MAILSIHPQTHVCRAYILYGHAAILNKLLYMFVFENYARKVIEFADCLH